MLGSFRLTFLGIVCTALTAIAADGPIRLPVAPPIPTPMPAPPEPGGVLRLAAGELYPVDSDVEIADIVVVPEGLVKFEKATPGTFYGKFAGGNGQWIKREIKGPVVYLGTANGKGTATIVIVPVGAKTKADVVKAVVDVDSAGGDCPPPKPKPDPKPQPKVEVAWVVIVEETDARTAATAKVLGDLAYWQGLKSRGVSWHFYDKDSPDAKVRNFDTFAAEIGLPAVLLLAADGKKVDGFKLPATTADLDAKLKEVSK